MNKTDKQLKEAAWVILSMYDDIIDEYLRYDSSNEIVLGLIKIDDDTEAGYFDYRESRLSNGSNREAREALAAIHDDNLKSIK
jgi:hypothetical protein